MTATKIEPLSFEDAVAAVTAENPIFETAPVDIRGVTYKAFRNTPQTLRELLQHAREAQGNGADEYLVFGEERWTYDEFCNDIKRVAKVLSSRFGIGKGDRVGIAMRNAPELLLVFTAAASLGAVAVFLNAWWTTEELDYAIGDADVRLIFADGKRLDRLRPLAPGRRLTLVGVRDAEALGDHAFSALMAEHPRAEWPEEEIHPDDDFAIMYSSGTTSAPKGVVQTHRGAVNAVYSWLMHAFIVPKRFPERVAPDPAPRPIGLVATPLFHVTATHPVFLLSLPAGAKLVLMDRWDAETAVTLIREEKITRFLGVPTQSADLLQAAHRMGEGLETLDFVGAGGAKRPAAQVGELHASFPKADVATGWGMTETNAMGIGMQGEDYLARPGAAGRLYPPVQEIRFLDDEGADVPFGEVGEITVKSPCNMRCYLNKPEETAAVFQDGWLRTGDLGQIDADGFITIVDRKKNIIIRGGENIACLDVEGALHRHPAVAEACAFALPHERLGEVVGACVQLRPHHRAEETEIKAFLAEHIAHFKIPERIWMQADPLPRGATDKIDRRVLRAACLAELEPAAKSEEQGTLA
ncbi:class I adenylate-forming enzyme family protein [Pseudodonghicola flavimaris]|uniref:Class I adenylate-forming enzyme family protein n=1 Tax=Pseudodonghicola flavimaris TaxID=3050036 RepID=A0ABT7F101_9RHOB|nr:class I adenylate-forming enzyme family protein [Pseudodonghicola flavimaris]MDK3018273.1 class I adenylate-forming enzyme family protein [Pseudodonghicola flavimaris]